MCNGVSGNMSMLAHNARAVFTFAAQEATCERLNGISLHYIMYDGLILHPKNPTE
jgi:hypothetical protein